MDQVKCKVIGENTVAGVEPGGYADLDPAVVNVDALVAGGHVELSKIDVRKLDKPAPVPGPGAAA